MRRILPVLVVLLAPSPCHAAPQQLDGRWTGGFYLDGGWVMVNVRPQGGATNGTADVVFPYYGGSQNAIDVPLTGTTRPHDGLHLEIATGEKKVVLDGRRQGYTISGTFGYGGAKGSFGLTRIATVTPDSLTRYYGAYRVSPDRVISIMRGWGSPRTLNYVDYKTGRVGTLWPSPEGDFFSGTGLAVSYPVTLRVSFGTDAAGNVLGLSWRESHASSVTASRIPTREERLTFQNGAISLGGTLILPEGKGPFRVIVITPGDFGTSRDQLRLWAHNYVRRGIAALVFDSRGAGESTGPVSSTSFPDLAGDVLAIVDALKARPDIDPHQIGLFGFSNSSWTVSLAASRSKDVGFLILQSLVGIPPWQQDIHRAETQLRVDRFPEDVVKKGAEFTRRKFEVARTGKGWEELEAVIEGARGERWIDYTNPPRTLERLRQVYETSMTYDPVPALEALRTPVLAYWGENDTYLPVAESVSIFKQAMAKAGNTNYVVRIYPNAQHDLIEGTGSPIAGATSLKFPAGFWAMKADWVLQH